MRVLFVTHNFPRRTGDLPGNFLLRLAVALQAVDVHVDVIAPHTAGLADSDTVDAVPVSRFHYAPDARETLAYGGTMAAQVAGSWRARVDLAKLIRAARRATSQRAAGYDVVHAHWWFPSGLAVTSALRGTPPVVTTLHGSDVRFGVKSAVSRPLMRRTLRRSARVTAVSQWLADQAHEVSGVVPLVAPMPADTSLFTPEPAARGGLLFVGKLDAQKGLDVLLRALTHLPRDIGLTVVGDGIDAEALRATAGTLDLVDRIRWTGAQPQTALPGFYRRAELVITPAAAPEGLGLVGVEALLCETPVIASDLGGARDIVESERTGLLVPPGDAAALARAIADALGNASRRAEWGREGRTRMLARFAPASCAAVYRTVYAEASRAGA